MSGMKRLSIPVLLLLVALAAAPAVADAAARKAPRGFHGVMWDRAASSGSVREQEEQWALMARSGVESVRTVFSWADAQPEADAPDNWSRTDADVSRAARHGIGLLPVVLYTPRWARIFPGRHSSPPRNSADFAAFMGRLVERYGPDGTFWAEHPELPRRPLRDWQIWNEPHFDFYWFVPEDHTAGWAPEYVDLLKQAYRAVKAADPGARVVLAGLADASWRELRRVYAAGARRYFDVATINIFTARPGFVIAAARLTRRVMRSYRQPRKPIWVTETTFPAAKGLVPPPEASWQRRWYTTRRGMAKRLARLYTLGARNARRLRLQRIYWYTWASSYTGRDELFDYSGLVRFSEGEIEGQPALRAFRRSARMR